MVNLLVIVRLLTHVVGIRNNILIGVIMRSHFSQIADAVCFAGLLLAIALIKSAYHLPVFMLLLAIVCIEAAAIIVDKRCSCVGWTTMSIQALLIDFAWSMMSMITSLLSLFVSVLMMVAVCHDLVRAEDAKLISNSVLGLVAPVIMLIVVVCVLLRLMPSVVRGMRLASVLSMRIASAFRVVDSRAVRNLWLIFEVALTMSVFLFVGLKGWTILCKLYCLSS